MAGRTLPRWTCLRDGVFGFEVLLRRLFQVQNKKAYFNVYICICIYMRLYIYTHIFYILTTPSC